MFKKKYFYDPMVQKLDGKYFVSIYYKAFFGNVKHLYTIERPDFKDVLIDANAIVNYFNGERIV